ncbi:MAG: penicillin-binding protein 1C [Candidatus Accumulibacter sp.]|uniref:penicillin-binding protein 1C n=1 Tax=Accumulibacter sp. TaxID=2053492 RepID=UPI001B2EFA66|nr:penicillin-binding protein 1C [Accumulibacter sp.]MBO3703718.1 penicillin-binding protein 1C [Accumulibacter sp.]
MTRWLELALAAALSLLLLADQLWPPPLPGRSAPQAQLVVARDGTPLRAFPDGEHIWRHPIGIEDVSPRYIEALVAYEDRSFWWHPGVNPWALLRAGWQWLRHGDVVSGGSTLSMQVARLLEPTPRSVAGKLQQIVRALQLELHLSKREILEVYLSFAPMGGVVEGVEAASRAYLGKPAQRLSDSEAALLTVLPQAPSRLRPDRYPERARQARDKVLDRLQSRWGAAAIADARQEAVIAQSIREPLLAPLLAERLRRMRPQAARIDSTIDASMQQSLEYLLAARLPSLPPRVSMAALVVDNRTLEVRAYAGSADFTDNARFAHVDMVQAARSPGSTLKPFLYGLALDEGLIHSESLLADVPQSFSGYQPGNFQADFSGPVSVSEALHRSLNVPAVEVLERLGAQRFVSLLRRGGLKLELPRGAEANLSVILGGTAVNLEGLVGAYTALARAGVSGRPRYFPDAPIEEARMLSEGAAFIIRDVLEAGGPVARQVNDGVGIRRGIAWKTGTSFGFRDAWAVGVSDRFTVGVWIGRPDGTPNPGFFGANIAAPLLVDAFAVIDDSPPAARTPPASVSATRICWPLGTRSETTPPELCHQERTAWILNDAAPPTFADRLRAGGARYTDYRDRVSGLRVRAACAAGEMTAVDMARWPAALEPWLDVTTRERALPPDWAPACVGARSPEGGLHIVGISDGATIRRAGNGPAPELRLEARGGQVELIWLVNGRQIGRVPAGRALQQRFSDAGRYQITVLDDAGRYDRVEISVR